MPVTLAQAKLNAQDDIQAGVIDEFRKSSYLLDSMAFHDAVNPSGNGATLTYGYTRLITESTAGFRAFNNEYTAGEATKQRYSVDLKVFGGKFQIDRVLAKSSGLVDEINFQMGQKIKSARALFHDTFINGDTATNANAFDGINVAVTGSSTEHNKDASKNIDLSTSTALDNNYKVFMDELELFLALLDEKPTALMGNSKLMTKIKQVARRAGYLTSSEDGFGRKVDAFDGIPLIDLGAKPASTNPIVPIVDRTVSTTTYTGLTDLFACRLGMDGVHGVSLAGEPLVNTWLPNFKTAGAVKDGEVEMVSAIAVKATKSAGVFRNIKVQ